METGTIGLLKFLHSYAELAEGRVNEEVLLETYSFLRGKNVDLGSYFEKEVPDRLEVLLAIDAFVHEAHSKNSDILGQTFECDLDVAADVALPLFDSLAGMTLVNPVRKQVRGFESPDWLDSLLLLKADEPLVVAGYASIEMVDREKHLIPRDVLAKAFIEFMGREGRRNVQIAHSNYQAGEVLESWTSPRSGETFNSGVDEKGLFIVVKVFPDTTVGKRIVAEIQRKKISAFSISGLAKLVEQRNGYKEVRDLELYEVSLCETPVNQGAYFSIAKARAISIEEVASAFQKTVSLGWTVGIGGSATLPFGYKDEWLERALKMRIGRRPMLHGTYELLLKPYHSLAEGIRLSDYTVTVVGSVARQGFSSNDCDILIRHSKTSPLGLTIFRKLSNALPEGLRDVTRFQFVPEGPHDDRHCPVYFLAAKRV